MLDTPSLPPRNSIRYNDDAGLRRRSFGEGSGRMRRSALVILNLALFAGNGQDGLVRLASQVHVDNTP